MRQKIAQIIATAGFSPLFATRNLSGRIAFTLVPYPLPTFFMATPSISPSSLLPFRSSCDPSSINIPQLARQIKRYLYHPTPSSRPMDDSAISYAVTNIERPKGLAQALQQALSDPCSSFDRYAEDSGF